MRATAFRTCGPAVFITAPTRRTAAVAVCRALRASPPPPSPLASKSIDAGRAELEVGEKVRAAGVDLCSLQHYRPCAVSFQLLLAPCKRSKKCKDFNENVVHKFTSIRRARPASRKAGGVPASEGGTGSWTADYPFEHAAPALGEVQARVLGISPITSGCSGHQSKVRWSRSAERPPSSTDGIAVLMDRKSLTMVQSRRGRLAKTAK